MTRVDGLLDHQPSDEQCAQERVDGASTLYAISSITHLLSIYQTFHESESSGLDVSDTTGVGKSAFASLRVILHAAARLRGSFGRR